MLLYIFQFHPLFGKPLRQKYELLPIVPNKTHLFEPMSMNSLQQRFWISRATSSYNGERLIERKGLLIPFCLYLVGASDLE